MDAANGPFPYGKSNAGHQRLSGIRPTTGGYETIGHPPMELLLLSQVSAGNFNSSSTARSVMRAVAIAGNSLLIAGSRQDWEARLKSENFNG
jgi:hypothetical protein